MTRQSAPRTNPRTRFLCGNYPVRGSSVCKNHGGKAGRSGRRCSLRQPWQSPRESLRHPVQIRASALASRRAACGYASLMAIAPKDGALASVAATRFPFAADMRCHVCRHPRRAHVEELMRAGCSSRQIRARLDGLGLWAPSAQSLCNHARKHLVARKTLIRIIEEERRIRAGGPGAA